LWIFNHLGQARVVVLFFHPIPICQPILNVTHLIKPLAWYYEEYKKALEKETQFLTQKPE
jgi:hypothetical protein